MGSRAQGGQRAGCALTSRETCLCAPRRRTGRKTARERGLACKGDGFPKKKVVDEENLVHNITLAAMALFREEQKPLNKRNTKTKYRKLMKQCATFQKVLDADDPDVL